MANGGHELMDQLSIINHIDSDWNWLIRRDPVRPHIEPWRRVSSNREVFVVEDGKSFKSVLCVAYIGTIPKTEDEVFSEWTSFNIACFYSVWSNERGYGRKIIQSTINHIRWNRPYITNAVTYSPKTDMAKNFHLANGAKLYRENETSYNFEYEI
jgi:hypothetical protein